ncbi:MAG: FHA domain-containing protein [Anaerolineae bacterium]|nr:FHA domain-containing protein [Caldilineales bacterium]MCX7852179.1 FHA domain-containing protein [Caldilineales bacterium]MDW8267538.1 FHA domain-containing protein [Anaerolineae bacterium]
MPALIWLPLVDVLALVLAWYRWGVAVGLAVTVVTTLWIFFDSQRRQVQATVWRVVSLLAALVVVPGAVLSLAPDLASALGQAPVVLALLGFLAVAVAFLCLLLYTLGVGVSLAAPADLLSPEPEPLFTTVASAPAPPPPPAAVTPPPISQPHTQVVDLSRPLDDRTRVLNPAPERPLPLAWLVVMNGPRAGKAFRLQELNDIGRDSRYNTISVEDPTMSRQHARVRLEKEGFVIYDLASANGVLVNGQREQRRKLENGDRITLGQTVFGFMIVKEE